MTRHITKPTPLPAVVRWPPSWTGRSNHHFIGTLVQAFLPFLEENLTPGYSLLPFFFSTDDGKVGKSVMLLYFHSKNLLFAKHRPILTSYSFPVFIAIVVSFRLLFVCQFIDGSWSTRQRVAGGQPTGDSDLQEASADQRVNHVGGPTHGDEELQETSTGQRVEDVGGRTPQRKLEE